MPYLCEQGGDKEHTDSKGATPLLCACSGGYLDVRPYLREQGADTEDADSESATPLLCACSVGYLDKAHAAEYRRG